MPVRIAVAAALVVASTIGVGLLFRRSLGGTDSLPLLVAASLVAQSVPLLVVIGVTVLVDRRWITDLGLGIDRDWWVDLGFGMTLGAGLMTGIFLVSLGLGWIRIVGWLAVDGTTMGFVAAFLFMTGFFAVAGIAEEVLVRGYLLTNLAEGLVGLLSRRPAIGTAVVVSSAVFGGAHVMNPNATGVSTLGIAIAGFLLAAGYVLTGDLAIPIGLHLTWNLFQGPVFGFPVSGMGFGVSLVDTVETGPDVATGGVFGPEAGLLGVGAIAVGILLVAGYVRRRYGVLRLNARLTEPALRWRGRGPS